MSPPMSIGALPQWLQRAVRNSKDCACAGVSVRLIVDDLEGDVERPELADLCLTLSAQYDPLRSDDSL